MKQGNGSSPVRRNRSRSTGLHPTLSSSSATNGTGVSGPINTITNSGNANNNANVNLWRLLIAELNIIGKGTDDENNNNNESIDDEKQGSASTPGPSQLDKSMDQILNLIRIPYYLEKFMCFGLLFCLNSFLTLITIIPLRLLINTVLFGRKWFINKRAEYFKINYKTIKHDLTYLFLLITTLTILKNLDTSKIYHNIKNGTAIKLYVMMGILEVADKLLCSLGQDLLEIMFSFDLPQFKILQIAKISLITVLSVFYLSCHSYVFIYQVMSFTVAINSYSNALLTLILSAQFGELKSSVFKKFEREGLFQISCADLTERFQLFTILFIISLKNLNIENNISSLKPNSWYLKSSNYINTRFGIVMGPTFVVIGSEILVDWLKYLYITKFNKIKPDIYNKYAKILSMDYIAAYRQYALGGGTNTNAQPAEATDNNVPDGSISLVRRVGLPLLAMVIVFVKMSVIPICESIFTEFDPIVGIMIIILIFTSVLFIRLILSLSLLKWSNLILLKHHPHHHPHHLHHHRVNGRKNSVRTTPSHSNSNISTRQQQQQVSSPLQDFVPGLPNTSLVELDEISRLQLYEPDEKIPPSLEEIRNMKVIEQQQQQQRKNSLQPMISPDVNDEKYDNLRDVKRFEMASKRIW